jgi:hypothetical protein
VFQVRIYSGFWSLRPPRPARALCPNKRWSGFRGTRGPTEAARGRLAGLGPRVGADRPAPRHRPSPGLTSGIPRVGAGLSAPCPSFVLFTPVRPRRESGTIRGPQREGRQMIRPSPKPTPTCVHFRVTEVPCAKCGSPMRLVLSEPSSPKFELMTYSCTSCEAVESFPMAIEPPSLRPVRR